MGSHHLRDASIPSSKVQEPLRPPLRADPEQLLELFRGKHEHGAATQKPKTVREHVRGRHTADETETEIGLRYSPIDGRAGDQGTEDCRHKGVVELGEQPAGLLHAPLEKSLGV